MYFAVLIKLISLLLALNSRLLLLINECGGVHKFSSKLQESKKYNLVPPL